MAFTLNGQPFNPYRAFTHNNIQYPANWFRLASTEEKAALGIEEVADPTPYDQRFYWGPDNPKLLNDRQESDEEGNPLYVQVYDDETESMVDTEERLVTKGLKSQWTAQVKDKANKLLAPNDWYVIRKAETDTAIPDNIATYRAAVKTECNRLETAIAAVTSVEELITVINGQNWPTLA
jgi:hypothetical protein